MTQWTMRQSLTFLIGSTLATLSLSLSGYFWYRGTVREHLANPAHQITALIQTGPEKEALPTAYLAELLGLAVDTPSNLYALDVRQAEEKLLRSSLIARAKVKKVFPHALYIDYETRRPVARLGDYANTAVDAKGYLFPLAPFFSPKEIPEIFLGLPSFGAPEDPQGRRGGAWHIPLEGRYFQLAKDVLKCLEGSAWKEGLRLKRVDVSNAFSLSLGQREIILLTEEELTLSEKGIALHCIFPKIVRLSSKNYESQIANFLALRKHMLEDYRKQIASSPQSGRFAPRIVDLRIPQLAFIENRS